MFLNEVFLSAAFLAFVKRVFAFWFAHGGTHSNGFGWAWGAGVVLVEEMVVLPSITAGWWRWWVVGRL